MTLIEEGDKAFCAFSGAIENNQAGFTGTGFANVVNASGAKLTWAISISKPGNYAFALRFANGGTVARPGVLAVAQQNKPVNFTPSGSWTQWVSESVTLNLTAGTHTITLTGTAAEGLPNIDSLTLTGPALATAAMCPTLPPVTIWIAGDSTVADGPTPCPAGWGKTIGSYFNDKVTIKNAAVGGRSVRTWLYDVLDQAASNGECRIRTNSDGSPILQARWTSMLEQMRPGDYLFIQFGINDGAATCPRHVGSTAFKTEYLYMANEALKRGVQPIVVTPSPALKCSGSTAVASRGFLTETFAVSQQLNIPVIDLHKEGTALYNQLAFCPVAGGDVSGATTGPVGEFFCDDHTHFDTPGARRMGAIITDALRNQSSPLPSYLK